MATGAGVKRFYIDDRVLSVIVFALLFAWLLAFPFEGQILYAIADSFQMEPHDLVFVSIAVHFAGLFSSGFVIKNICQAKRLMLFSLVYCILGTSVFFTAPSILWNIALISSSFLAGGFVASWGFYLKRSTAKNERIKTSADVLIYSNIMMILQPFFQASHPKR